jgi:PIN domain nuclease of toxin-antitoxin system
MGRPKVILLDTHVWIWLNAGELSLLGDLVDEMRDEPLAISVVSIWEALLLIEKKRIAVDAEPEFLIRQWLTNPIQIKPVTSEIAIRSRALPFNHNDPADRFIGATAFCHGLRLATADAQLKALSWLVTL